MLFTSNSRETSFFRKISNSNEYSHSKKHFTIKDCKKETTECSQNEFDNQVITKTLSLHRFKSKKSRIISTRLFVMLITINVSFCVLSMPMVILQIVYYSYMNIMASEMTSLEFLDRTTQDENLADSEELLDKIKNNQSNDLVDLLHAIAELLQYLNHGSNFILYSMSGSSFRNETIEFFLTIFRFIKTFSFCKKSF